MSTYLFNINHRVQRSVCTLLIVLLVLVSLPDITSAEEFLVPPDTTVDTNGVPSLSAAVSAVSPQSNTSGSSSSSSSGINPTNTPHTAATVSTSSTSSTPQNTTQGNSTATTSANGGSAGSTGPVGPGGVQGSSTQAGVGSDPAAGTSTPSGSVASSTNATSSVIGDVTGGITKSGQVTTIITTGDATASGEINTTVNSNSITSSLTATSTTDDLDVYSLTATGSNQAIVDNAGTTSAITGQNQAQALQSVLIDTGVAVSTLNIANIVNTNVINSAGFVNLLNQFLDGVLSLDLQDLFFPGGMSSLLAASSCTLLSCAAEDVIYNLVHQNDAVVTNTASIDAISGQNQGTGSVVSINTGASYGAANVINIVNTNIIDSNYRLLTINGIGTLNGDLVLPSEALLRAFFALPNGLNQVEDAADATLTDSNVNVAGINNNLNTFAETGANNATTTALNTILKTGTGYAASNVVNEVNHNLFGGDSLYMLIKVHGSWNGNVYGLPAGLSWEYTPAGIVIYNTGAEISPSQLLAYDKDSYTANFANTNNAQIDNNININAISGENQLMGSYGALSTSNAYAGANVLNVANTNVVGRNWVMAILNIFGDFNGNVSFGRADLELDGTMLAMQSPVGPGSKLVYTYTVKNSGDQTMNNVELGHVLSSAYIRYQGASGEQRAVDRREVLGTLLPGETRIISFDAYVDDNLQPGRTPVRVRATLTSSEPDSNLSNNQNLLAVDAVKPPPVPVDQGGGGSGGSSGGGVGGGGGSSNGSSGGGGGGGGGGKSTKGKVLGIQTDVSSKKIDPNKPPLITITKRASTANKDVVTAGTSVIYSVIVKNAGGKAYHAKVYDRLVNPIGAVVSEQAWDLKTIGAGEQVLLEYTVAFEANTPSGLYTNTARMVAYATAKDTKIPLKIAHAEHILEIKGQDLSIGNVGIAAFVPMNYGTSLAIVAWETSKPANGQAFFSHRGLSTTSPFSALLPNYGYEQSTRRTPGFSTKHVMLLTGLTNGQSYTFRLRSDNLEHQASGGDYFFTVPSGVTVITAGPATLGTVGERKASSPPLLAPKPLLEVAAKQAAVTGFLGEQTGFLDQLRKTLFGFFINPVNAGG